jgi:hypothetical protein
LANASTLPAPFQAIRRLARRRESPAPPNAISFPELVWAHFERQREIQQRGKLNGEAEAEYRARLAAFQASEGRLLNAYWCTAEASAVALTEKRRGRIFKRREVRFHAATDWIARDSPEVANLLHICETLAVRVSEVLGGAAERIAMQWILASAGHALGFVDREERAHDRRQTNRLVARKRRELEHIEAYYHRAGEKLGRIVYFWGMMIGIAAAGAIGVAVALLLWWLTGLDPSDTKTQNLYASYTMGAVGALVSVMTRMASNKEGSFNVDFEVGRGQLRSIASFRPFIGAVSGLLVFFAIEGGLVQVLPDEQQSFYLFAVLAFAAGFTERWTKVIVGQAERMLGGDGDEPDAKPTPKPSSDQGSRRV